MNLVLAEVGKSTKNAMAKILKKYSVLSLVLLGSFANLNAQTQGKIKIKADPRLEQELRSDINKNDSTDLKGYRIQIYFGNDKNDAEKIARKFKNAYPEYKTQTYLRYYQPYWRVRVGNYYRKIDAQSLLQELSKEFNNVLLIKDKIDFPEIHPADLEEEEISE